MATAFPGLLGSMQGQLGQFYDVHVPHDVSEFLVTDPDVLDALTAGSARRTCDEQLIVVESEGAVDVALYVNGQVLERLAAADPRQCLSGANLGDFWTVLEGVSHFHYLVWNAALDKPVTLLELEMQADVDKYVSTRLLMLSQPGTTLGGPLLQRLFHEPVLDPLLGPEEAGRYQAASSLAGRYCASLERRFPAAGVSRDMVRELRTFYRLPQAAKIQRIRSCGFA